MVCIVVHSVAGLVASGGCAGCAFADSVMLATCLICKLLGLSLLPSTCHHHYTTSPLTFACLFFFAHILSSHPATHTFLRLRCAWSSWLA
jgi:hypothetical protein